MARLIEPFEQFFDASGDPLAFGLLDFYESGGSTVRKATYADSAETIANTNPVVLNGDGRVPNIFGSGRYRVIVRSSTGLQISQKEIGGIDSLTFGSEWLSTQTYSTGDVARDDNIYWESQSNGNLGNRPSVDSGTNWLEFLADVATNTADLPEYAANGDFYTDSGATNAYVLSTVGSKQAPSAYVDGMRARAVITNTNTGASTVNVAGLGVKNIKLSGGTDPAAGDIDGRTELVYDAANGWFELLDPVSLILSPEKSQWPSLSNAADADHDITFSAGRILDSSGYQIINLLSSLTKQIDATWSQGDSAGGLFSGTVATNTAYHCFVIVKDSDMSIDAGFDTDINAANIPTGYTAYRRIHTVETDSSANIKGFTQSGDYIELYLQETIVNTTSPPTSSTNIQVVPVGSKKQARLRFSLSSSSSTINAFIDSKFSNSVTPALSTSSAVTSSTVSTFELLTDSLGEIQYRTTAGTITSFKINTLGWYDDRSE